MNDYIFRGVTQSNHKPSSPPIRAALQRDKTCSCTGVSGESIPSPIARLKSTSTAVFVRPSAHLP